MQLDDVDADTARVPSGVMHGARPRDAEWRKYFRPSKRDAYDTRDKTRAVAVGYVRTSLRSASSSRYIRDDKNRYIADPSPSGVFSFLHAAVPATHPATQKKLFGLL